MAKNTSDKTTAKAEDAVTVDMEVGEKYPDSVADAEFLAVRTKSGGSFWRGGQKFTGEWRFVEREALFDKKDWPRIATDPMLEVREVILNKVA